MNGAFCLRRRLPLLLMVVLTAGACSDSGLLDTPLPTTPTGTSITEDFSGTVNPNGAVSHPFLLQSAGTVTATVTALTLANPESVATGALVVGVSLGTWNGSSCAIASGIFNDFAGVGSSVTGNVSSPGTVCVRVYDVGRLTENVNYNIQVVHP